jgi:bacterioferritin
MKGDEKVIAALNEALKSELTAILQYMVHAEMQNDWGYNRLGSYIKKQAIDEMRHAEGLIERILFLDGIPNVNVMPGPQIGPNVQQQLKNDLAAETEAVATYNGFVKLCREVNDSGTREIFERMVTDEEQHSDWLESQLNVINEIGIQNYLAQQVLGGEGN